MSLLRALVQGQPGSGKTSLLAAAANAGYQVQLADFDQCPEPLFAYTNAEAKVNVHVTPFDNFDKFLRFVDKDNKYWGVNTILALDSLTEMTPFVEEYMASLNTNTDPRMLAWNTAKMIEGVCRKLKRLPCHVVVISHLRLVYPHAESGYLDKSGQFRGQDTPLQRQVKIERAQLEETAFYPNIPAETVARNFVHIFPFALLTEVDEKAKHTIGCVVRTKSISGYQIKCPIAGIADKLPIETALLTILAGIGA